MRALFAALVVALAVPAAAQAPRDPMVRENATQKLSDHVWAISDENTPMVPNVGFIVGAKGVLVVDTGMGARNGEIVLREARKVAPGRQIYLVTTHFHPEHDLGAGAFPADTRMIRSRDQEAEIAESGLQMANLFSQRSAFIADLLKGAQFRKADITFDTEHRLDLGGVTVRIMAMGANHTWGDTAAWVEPDRVLFTGDVAMVPLPVFGSPRSRLSHWLASLDKLEALKPTRVVASHGPFTDVSAIRNYRTYLTTVRDRTAAVKKQGKSVDEAVATVTTELASRYPDKGRVTSAVRAAYAEAS
jgi:glyoxylase-like metal-dependent hydrolase (beta-lactamase superfamily II)